MERDIRRRLDELGEVFRSDRGLARPVLESLFPDGLVATPIEVGERRKKRWRIEGLGISREKNRRTEGACALPSQGGRFP